LFARVLDRLIDHSACARVGPSVTTAPIGGAPLVHRSGYVAVPFAGRQQRLRRIRTARMRAALDVLRSAGPVDLSDDLAPTELKAAFRRLAPARPDLHPRASEHE